MPDIAAVDVDQAQPLHISVAGASPHTFAYRFWQQEPGETGWTKITEGHTADATPDECTTGPLAAGTAISYWIAVSGHPNSAYRVIITLSQNGAAVAGGIITHEGTTSASGGAVVQHQVALA